MNGLGVFTGLDICDQALEFMNTNIDKSGTYYYWMLRGVDDRPARANRIRKSISAENTFSVDLTTFDAMAAEFQPLIDEAGGHGESTGNRERTVTLKIKFFDFEIITRSRSVPTVVSSRDHLETLAIALLQAEIPFLKSVPARLVAVLAANAGARLDLPI
nr:DNA polymerase IV [Nitrobacter vulgaris]